MTSGFNIQYSLYTCNLKGYPLLSLIVNVLGRVQFLYRLKVEKNNELRGTDNIQGQISEHIFEVFIFYNP